MANVTREAFDKIDLGMWEAEVKEIFGDPDDDNHEDWANFIPTILIWENPDGSKVQVTFSHNKVTEKKYIEKEENLE
ncbi:MULTISPECIES: hypothetical protein [unclassified Anabaena]|uniref:hypothetical protein n=1 Tax=unclassified Anabaena TaxID=2619674 RepID=UPI0006AC9DA9|nr:MULTISPECIES: hypothetical protein [unclassified Anabaena]ALB39879.1 hypothetical protein AA650_04850 [Anabaena sp. WA102]OBQ17619.1 MAG: hypothetical protein AN486_14455 [Anabaena sp. AL93]